jgi:transcriptional regulator with XRE-family HTH domain
MSKTLRSPRHTRLLKLLLELRDSRNLTQVDIAVQLGRPQSFVSKYETGERRLDVIEYCDVVHTLGADPVEFLAELLRQETDDKSSPNKRHVRSNRKS